MSGTRIPCPPLTRRGGDLSGEGSGDGDNLSGGGPKEERKDASVIILSRGNVPLLSGALPEEPDSEPEPPPPVCGERPRSHWPVPRSSLSGAMRKLAAGLATADSGNACKPFQVPPPASCARPEAIGRWQAIAIEGPSSSRHHHRNRFGCANKKIRVCSDAVQCIQSLDLACARLCRRPRCGIPISGVLLLTGGQCKIM